MQTTSFSNARGTRRMRQGITKLDQVNLRGNIVLSASRSFKADGSRPSESTVLKSR